VHRDELERAIGALDEGRAYLPLDGFRAVEVEGHDASSWLQDLVTADVEALVPGDAVRSLLLGPTGHIRADLHVVREADAFVLLQALDQPAPIDGLLAPYVLSSDVVLREPPTHGLVAVPGVEVWRFRTGAGAGLEPVSPSAVETWRIRRGIARFPVDLDEGSLPSEAGLDDGIVIDRAKGCFLGQESVARVRNLGHPARVVLALRAEGPARPGDAVLADGSEAGVVTSAETPDAPGAVLARVRWPSRGADLGTSAGVALRA
jgi:folate-binding protein YgfZ